MTDSDIQEIAIEQERYSRRRILGLGGAALLGLGAHVLVSPTHVHAEERGRPPGPPSGLIDPYNGSVPLVFPVAEGKYQSPVANNWHASRQGAQYAWNHRTAKPIRAHDGIDIYPNGPLPQVYAPVAGKVVAVCTRPQNTLASPIDYRVSGTTPPPWNYSQAIDSVDQVPLYGNFVWIRSTDPASVGYFMFYCHLQYESTIQSLNPDQNVTIVTPVGVLGDTGNAVGFPQLHVELHYPVGNTFGCTKCSPKKTLTAVNPFRSLTDAVRR